jgi:putative Mg2+ transporter-C (MgtC) family protein
MDLELASEDIIKLLLAVLIGGLIGAEREYRDKAAGFRTMIFICVGSTLFTMYSLKLAKNTDPERIAAQIVTGVGFLGAGIILRDTGGRVAGLTTAAMIWIAAALGMGIGGAEYSITLLAAVLVWIILWGFPSIERRIDNRRRTGICEITCTYAPGRFEELEKLVHDCGLRAFELKRGKAGDYLVVMWEVRGSPHSYIELTERLFAHPDVKEFHF